MHLSRRVSLSILLVFIVSLASGWAQAPLLEEVVFSQKGGLIDREILLNATDPVISGGVVRYTLDNTEPNDQSPEWNGSLSVTTSTVGARAHLCPGCASWADEKSPLCEAGPHAAELPQQPQAFLLQSPNCGHRTLWFAHRIRSGKESRLHTDHPA